MSDGCFSTLEQVFQMVTPSDLGGGQAFIFGGPLNKVDNAIVQMQAILENNGKGVYKVSDLVDQFRTLSTPINGGSQGVDLSKYIAFYSTQGFIDALGSNVEASKMHQGTDGSTLKVSSIQEIVGKDFTFAAGTKAPNDIAIVLSKTPFFNPSTRNTRKAEIFLNSMPSTVLQQLVPYMQVEFQTTRSPSPFLQTVGQLKFLLGAVDKATTLAAGPNKALIEGHQVTAGGVELDYAGMELFTSPQTLVNPQPNRVVQSSGGRYADVLDPFRPFASLEHVVISSVPAVGMFSYKKATMTIKVHDRSRLSEISDLIRPRVYTGVTIWMTYGWRAPVRSGVADSTYFDYVNNNLMMREAYGIVNSSFSFDNVGQVTLTLELFTKGVNEMRQVKVSDNKNDMAFRTDEINRLIEQVSEYRQRLKLDPPEGLNKEVRAFQILEAAEVGEFPDLKANDVAKSIDQLQQTLGKTANVDQAALSGLINGLKKLYTPDNNDKTKFSFKTAYQTRVTQTISSMFKEVETGPDPFLPITAKVPAVGSDIARLVDQYNLPAKTQVGTFKKKAVSFGKLFSVFALRAIASMDTFDEVQVFFYNLNGQCGPISNHSIAEFPIDMAQFLDQYRELVVSRGGEKITLEDFLQLAINAQFLDKRAIGYGLRQYYLPYDPKNKDPLLKDDQKQNFESALSKYTVQYGPFKQPVVEMFIEVAHERPSGVGDSDTLQLLNYSSKDATALNINDVKGKQSRKIMRLHVYDKQTTANRAGQQLLKNEANTGFVLVPSTDYAKSLSSLTQMADGFWQQAVGVQIQEDAATGAVQLLNIKSNQQIKDIVSKLVPTIRFGANGTTITQASLASKADPLLSTVQMIRSMTVKNGASPTGAGEGGIPLRVIPAQLSMTTLGNPLACMAQSYMIDFQTGTTLDNLYIVIGLTHSFSPGKFETQWSFGYADAYGVFEGAPNLIHAISSFPPEIPTKGNGATQR
jgi:hypothetical protein